MRRESIFLNFYIISFFLILYTFCKLLYVNVQLNRYLQIKSHESKDRYYYSIYQNYQDSIDLNEFNLKAFKNLPSARIFGILKHEIMMIAKVLLTFLELFKCVR